MLQKVKGWLSEVRPGVQIFETIMCQLPMEILLGAFREDSPEGNSEKSLNIHVHELKAEKEDHHHHNHHQHDLMFDTWSYTSFKPIQISLFNELLKNLPSTLFRAKGFLICCRPTGQTHTISIGWEKSHLKTYRFMG